MLADRADAPTVPRGLVALGGLVGLFAPPLGPFTRAAYGARCATAATCCSARSALDSAGEEAAVIFAPLLVARLVAGLLSPEAGARDRGRGAAGRDAHGDARTSQRAGAPIAAPDGPDAAAPDARCGCSSAALGPTAAALGAIDISLPAATREQGHPARRACCWRRWRSATVAGSLLAGRGRWRGSPQWRVVATAWPLMAGGLALDRDRDVVLGCSVAR